MYGLYLTLVLYFGIGICFYIGICMGVFDLSIQSKATGEFLDKNSGEYEILKFVFSIGWIVMAFQAIRRGGDTNGNNH